MKRLIALAACLCAALALFGGCAANSGAPAATTPATGAGTDGEASQAPAGTPRGPVEKIVVLYPAMVGVPVDLPAVQDEVNKLLAERIDVEVSLNCIAIANYAQQVNLMIAANEQADMIETMPMGPLLFTNMTAQHQLLDITGLLTAHGQGLTRAINEISPDSIKCTTVDGKVYGVPGLYNRVSGVYLSIRKDVLDNNGLDLNGVKNMADVEAIFATLKEKETTPILVGQTAGAMLFPFINPDDFSQSLFYDGLGDFTTYKYGIIENNDPAMKVLNYYKSDLYKNMVTMAHDWYAKGYIYKDSATTQESGQTLVKDNAGLGMFLVGERGVEVSQDNRCGREMVTVRVADIPVNTSNVIKFSWVFPVSSKHPEAAMKYLDLTFTDPAIVNLLDWGIEGRHYVANADGTIRLPDGVTPDKNAYNFNADFLLGNQFLSKVWAGNPPDLRELAKADNVGAKVVNTIGFTVNNATMTNEMTAISNVITQYNPGLMCGALDPAGVLPEFQKALDSAGYETVIAEVQKQLDAWRK